MEKLNCKSLMIGDWVYIKDYPMIKSPQRIRPEHFVRSLVDFEPIPLTPEILEKNGFKSRKDGYDIGIPLLYWDKYCTAVCGWTHCDDIIEVFDCKYVHELQHALKLCRIEKEIEL